MKTAYCLLVLVIALDTTGHAQIQRTTSFPSSASAPIRYLCPFRDKIFMLGFDAAHGFEPWFYNPNSNSFTLLADINPGSLDGYNPGNDGPDYFVVLNDTLYFPANDGIHGNALWQYDGSGNPKMVLRTDSLGTGSQIRNICIYQNNLYFIGSKLGVDGIYSLDRNVDTLIKIFPAEKNTSHLSMYELYGFDSSIIVTAGGLSGREAYVHRLSSDSLRLIDNIWPGPVSGSPSNFLTLNNHLYCSAEAINTGRELFCLMNANDTFRLVRDFIPGYPHGLGFYSFEKPIQYNGNLYFGSNSTTTGIQALVFKTDTVGFNIQHCDTLLSSIYSANPHFFFELNGQIYFVPGSSSSPPGDYWNELWFITPSGVSSFRYTYGGIKVTDIREPVHLGNAIYFIGQDSTSYTRTLFRIGSPNTYIKSVEQNVNVAAYPNPCRGLFYLRNNLSPSLGYVHVTIFNLSGNIVSTAIMNPQSNLTIDLRSYPKGNYVWIANQTNGPQYNGKISLE